MINRLETMNGHLHWKVNFLYGVLNLYDYNFFLYLVTFILFGMYCYLVAYNDKWIKKTMKILLLFTFYRYISSCFTSGVTFADPRHAAKTCLQFPWILYSWEHLFLYASFFSLFWKPKLVSLCLHEILNKNTSCFPFYIWLMKFTNNDSCCYF